jgi:hypothetical protein
MLSRIRVGMRFQPVDWFKISAMGQDSRVPFYGAKPISASPSAAPC